VATRKKAKHHDGQDKQHDGEATPRKAGRSIWSGAISFGLLQIPVGLHSAEMRQERVHFHLLDKKDLSRVRYKRVNEKTGREVEWSSIVKGYELEPDQYVVLDDEDLAKANVKATRTIDIRDFVPRQAIAPQFFETPYYLVPDEAAAKAYVLLRDALAKKDAVAIATFVLRSREHLVALMAEDDAIVLEVLRFAHELKKPEDLDLPHTAGKVMSEREREMGERLVESMMSEWSPAAYKDTYYRDVLAIVKEKAERGETTEHHAPPVAEEGKKNVLDLFDVLKRSLEASGGSKVAHGRPSSTRAKAHPHKPLRKASSRATKTRHKAA
jgi:DNA end-binding protein Ku